MKTRKVEKYWESEEGETIEFGNCFMRCFDIAGKLQFGTFNTNAKGEKTYYVKFVIDKVDLITSDEGCDFLLQVLEDWNEQL